MQLFATALNSARGGGEVHLLRLFRGEDDAAAWMRQNVTVCLRYKEGPLQQALGERGVRLWQLPTHSMLPVRVAAIRRQLQAAAAPVLLYLNCLPRDLDYLLAACLTPRCATVIHLHTAQYGHEVRTTVSGYAARLLPPLLRALCQVAGARVLATSKYAAQALFRGIGDYVWAPPIVAEGPGPPELPDTLLFASSGTLDVAFVGRLHQSPAYTEAKNAALLVAALRWMVTTAGRRVRLHLVADGNALPATLAALEDAGVTVIPHRDLAQPWDVIPAEAVVVAPSRHEGFSLVVAEAQWHGRRTVISAAIPEEAVFLPELVRRLPATAGAQQWGEAIVALAGVRQVRVSKPIRLPEACTRLGHIALLQKVAARCGC